jgi:hypothetical protein
MQRYWNVFGPLYELCPPVGETIELEWALTAYRCTPPVLEGLEIRAIFGLDCAEIRIEDISELRSSLDLLNATFAGKMEYNVRKILFEELSVIYIEKILGLSITFVLYVPETERPLDLKTIARVYLKLVRIRYRDKHSLEREERRKKKRKDGTEAEPSN